MATVALELGAPLALWPRLRTAWVVGAWGLHAAIAATMFVVFPYPLTLVAFAPVYRLERLGRTGAGSGVRDKRVLGPWRPGRHQHDD